MSRPLCRVCGKQIAKKTTEVDLSNRGLVTTRAEAARLVNGEIASIRRGYGPRSDQIVAVNVWDGESYVDPFFHSEGCAAAFGRSMAEQFPDFACPAYREAVAKQRRP